MKNERTILYPVSAFMTLFVLVGVLFATPPSTAALEKSRDSLFDHVLHGVPLSTGEKERIAPVVQEWVKSHCVSLVAPTNEAIAVPRATRFQWQPDNDVLGYDLYLSSDIGEVENVQPQALLQANMTETEFTPLDRLKSGSEYYWRVVAKLRNGTTKYSSIWSFTTRVPSHEVLIETAKPQGFVDTRP